MVARSDFISATEKQDRMLPGSELEIMTICLGYCEKVNYNHGHAQICTNMFLVV